MTELNELQEPPSFLYRLLVATLSVLLVVLVLYLLRELRGILQPLLIACFIGYLILPAHVWLGRHGVPQSLVRIVFLILVLGGLFLLVHLVHRNYQEALQRLPEYQARMLALLERGISRLPGQRQEVDAFLNELPILHGNVAEHVTHAVQITVGPFLDFLTLVALVIIYLVFMLAERASFPERMRLAFGPTQGERVLGIVQSINQAIAQYIAVKTSVSALAGFGSLIVLALFGVDFAVMWAILIFLLNYIPYLGSLVAVALPIALAFLQFDEAWKGIVIAALLIGIQQFIGTFLEPRMAGHKLGVSPLLILLALAFWGLVWGMVGMILAVPLLVTVKIILDNIPETKPLATLMSNL